MTKCSIVALLGLLLSLQGLLNAGAGRTSGYERPPARPLLPMEHKLLARPSGVSPHVPEQVHLSLAGPGSMAVSWLTYPQVSIATFSVLVCTLLAWSMALKYFDAAALYHDALYTTLQVSCDWHVRRLCGKPFWTPQPAKQCLLS